MAASLLVEREDAGAMNDLHVSCFVVSIRILRVAT